MFRSFKTLIAFLALCFLFSCASFRPILNDNAQYQKVGELRAEQDIDDCMTKADTYLAKHKDDRLKKQMGRSAVGGAIIGGIIGAVGGGDVGSAAGGAAVGAGVGATDALIKEKTKDNLTPDDLKQAYVQKCLEGKKYEVLGWK